MWRDGNEREGVGIERRAGGKRGWREELGRKGEKEGKCMKRGKKKV